MAVATYLGGCAPKARSPFAATTFSSEEGPLNHPVPPTLPVNSGAVVFTEAGHEGEDQKRLADLWAKRTQERAAAQYPVGPGDVLSVTVAGMDELREQSVRVGADGVIVLPLVGTIQAAGLTEEEVRREVQRRLEADYMHNPQVQLFVKEYRSRQVAVVGAVAKPGLYGLASGVETILDMVSQAGGVTDDAASYLNFLPAESLAAGKAQEIASTMPMYIGSTGMPSIGQTDPIPIALRSLAREGTQPYLALPVRPGDVIMVPSGGDVMIDGWVERPGSYKVTRDLTVLGAVAAAGGALYAADTRLVKVIRQGQGGEKIFFIADLESIKAGQQPDIPIEGGDVIQVPSSTAKMVPYGFYKFVTSIFNVGTSAPLY